MKNLLLAVIVAITAFAAGLGGAWLLSKPLQQRLNDQLDFSLTREPEVRARLSLITIEQLQAGNTGKALEANCRMLRSSLPLLNFGESDSPARRAAVQQLVQRGQSTVTALEASGSCGE